MEFLHKFTTVLRINTEKYIELFVQGYLYYKWDNRTKFYENFSNFLHVWVCTCECTCVCVRECVNVHCCGDWKSASGVLPQLCPPLSLSFLLFWDRASHWNLGLLSWARLTLEIWDSLNSPPQLFTWVLGIELSLMHGLLNKPQVMSKFYITVT